MYWNWNLEVYGGNFKVILSVYVAFFIMMPWVPMLLWYLDCSYYQDYNNFLVPTLFLYQYCLYYYDTKTAYFVRISFQGYHNSTGKYAYLVMISGLPILLIYPDLIKNSSACLIMIPGVPILFIYTDCLCYYDICQK